MEGTIAMSGSPISFTPAAILSRLGPCSDQLLAGSMSEASATDPSALLKQLSLHLPRFAASQLDDRELVLREAQRLARKLKRLQAPHLQQVPSPSPARLADLQFCRLADEVAEPILNGFHYILSFREDSLHFGLKRPSEEWPVIMASLSPFDLNNVEPALAADRQTVRPLVLSRVFAFPAVPRNAFSFLMSRVRQWLASHLPEVNILLTYINPNIGFSGSSYKADNWKLMGQEHGTRYLYLEDDYKTDRFLYRHFGQPVDALLSSPNSHVSASRHRLQPLHIFLREVTGVIPLTDQGHFERWHP